VGGGDARKQPTSHTFIIARLYQSTILRVTAPLDEIMLLLKVICQL
jgi:hypothetical protein